MKEKITKLLGLLMILVISLTLTPSIQAFDFTKKVESKTFRNVVSLMLFDDDDKDKILAVCQATSKFPKGWVVIGQGNVNDCSSNSIAQPLYNAWFIKKPAKQDYVCQGSPLPDDYAIVGKVKIADCPGGSSLTENKNGWIIKLIE